MRKPKNLNAAISATVAAIGVAIAAHAAVEQDQHHDTVTKQETTVADLQAQVDDLTASLYGQYDVNADYADQIAGLKADLAEVTEQRDQAVAIADDFAADIEGGPAFWEDGSYELPGGKTGCAPTALCDDEYQESLASR